MTLFSIKALTGLRAHGGGADQAMHARQADIHQHDVRFVLDHHGDGLVAVVGTVEYENPSRQRRTLWLDSCRSEVQYTRASTNSRAIRCLGWDNAGANVLQEVGMGRKSRLKAERRAGTRQPTEKELARAAHKANLRGQRVGNTLADYEREASIESSRILNALIARHIDRMNNLPKLPVEYRALAVGALLPVTLMDMVLIRYGADKSRLPAAYQGSWIDHLSWGVNSAVATVRLLLAGQLAGAAVLARHQLERWTNHRAFNTDTKRIPGERVSDFIARVWSNEAVDHYGKRAGLERSGPDCDSQPTSPEEPMATAGGEPAQDHAHVTLSDGTEVCPAAAYCVLSDVLHALEAPQALKWDSQHRCQPDATPPEAYGVATAVVDVVSLNLRQIRGALLTLAQERYDLVTLRKLRDIPDRVSEETYPDIDLPQSSQQEHPDRPEQIVLPEPWALLPLHPLHGLREDAVRAVDHDAALFDEVLAGRRPTGRLYHDDEFLTLAFAWHRRTAVRNALKSLDREREIYKERFDLDGINTRDMACVLASEAAGVVSGWNVGEPISDALALVGSAVRSAYWLWLEDDDRAMAVLRTVLEQISRVRVWRTKPDRATRLERSDKATPRDWLAAAGWRRLEALNRALGQLAHSRVTSNWHGAHELLAELQIDADPDTSIFTARGHCLDLVVALACREIVATAHTLSEVVALTLTDLFKGCGMAGVEFDGQLEALLNHIWTKREHALDETTFTGPALDWMAGRGPSGLHH